MESVGQTMSHMNRARQFNYEDLVVQILADQEVAAFIKKFDGVFQNLINTLVNATVSYWEIRIILPKVISPSSPWMKAMRMSLMRKRQS